MLTLHPANFWVSNAAVPAATGQAPYVGSLRALAVALAQMARPIEPAPSVESRSCCMSASDTGRNARSQPNPGLRALVLTSQRLQPCDQESLRSCQRET